MKIEGVSRKTSRILKIILGAFLVILFRVWHLEVIQREEKQKEAAAPMKRTVLLKADRGPIYDRFQIPLAVNKICYNAAVYYDQILQIPSAAWKENEAGESKRCYPRREYIRQVSEKLAALLDLEPSRIEDLIHSKASLFPTVPFVLKSGLSEKEYYQLAAVEKDWVGIHAEISSERFYPQGKCGSSVIGSMGSISSKEYFSIAEEIAALAAAVEEAEQGHPTPLPPEYDSFEGIAKRLQELKEKAYRLQDLIGKSGIEGKFEQQLRGFYGQKSIFVDQKGKFLNDLPGGREAIPGKQLNLTLSIELQEFAESLLTESEALREGRSLGFDPETKERKALKQPWIKGGAIIAMDPNTGEVLALATTPRFDPNDFIPSMNAEKKSQKQKNLHRWLENERLIADLWDGCQDLKRERYSLKSGFSEESAPLTWDRFLEIILSDGSLKVFFHRVDDVKTAIQVQEDFDALLYHCKQSSPLALPLALLDQLYPRNLNFAPPPEAAAPLKRLDALLTPLASNNDRLFAIDLCRLAVYAPAFTDELLKLLGSIKLTQYRSMNQAVCQLESELRESARSAFHQTFETWREKNQKEFLAKKREEEKKEKRSPRPYLDYLDQKENELFLSSWKEERQAALLTALPPSSLMQVALPTFRMYDDLTRPLLGTYRRIRKAGEKQLEKHLAASFYPIGGFGTTRSYAFQASAPQGSIFKLVAGYAGLLQTGGENPLTLIDEVKMHPFTVASSLTGVPYPRIYKGGRLPKSSRTQVGKIDLAGALEQTSNSYFSILAGDVLQKPEDLLDAARLLGFGAPTGIDLGGEGSGRLPEDLNSNRTGLYSTAIGQHTLLVTPLQTAVMLSALANGGKVLKPTLAKEPNNTHVQRVAKFPGSSRNILLEGMNRVLWSSKGTAKPGRRLLTNPTLMSEYLALRHQIVGKTSTAEILFNPHLNPFSAAQMYKHIWFGLISFEGEYKLDHPELVVVVFLRYGDAGREAAPLAAQMVTKWRAIKKLHLSN